MNSIFSTLKKFLSRSGTKTDRFFGESDVVRATGMCDTAFHVSSSFTYLVSSFSRENSRKAGVCNASWTRKWSTTGPISQKMPFYCCAGNLAPRAKGGGWRRAENRCRRKRCVARSPKTKNNQLYCRAFSYSCYDDGQIGGKSWYVQALTSLLMKD